LNSTVPLAHKRQDETGGIIQNISAANRPPSLPLLVFGSGLGATYVGPTGIEEPTYEAHSHDVKHYTFDTYLGTLLRMGLLGEVVLGLWLAAFAAYAVAVWWRGPSPTARMFGAASVGALSGVALMSFIDPYVLAH